MKIKKYISGSFSLLLLAVFLVAMTGCNDFEEYNTDPTKSATVNPNSQLSYAQLSVGGDWMLTQVSVFYFSGFIQHLQGDYSVTNWGGIYQKSGDEFNQFWNRIYGTPFKNLVDIVERTAEDPLYHNVRTVARIFRVYYAMLLTDALGDVPYFEAGKGYLEGIAMPAYDKQEDIYMDFLKELKEVAEGLDDDGDQVTGDIFYNGSLGQWRKFANTLRLRLAMRLVKVAPETAKQHVMDVMGSAAGCFTSASDDAIIEFMDILDWDTSEIRRNGWSQLLRGYETYPTAYLCSTLWNYLRDTGDPRLLRLGRCYDESSNDPFSRNDITEDVLASAAGMDQIQPVLPGYFWWDNWPNGYWSDVYNEWFDKFCRPQVNHAFLRGNAPGIILTYAECQLLLAEAVTRWGTDVPNALSAEAHYQEGVRAAMELLARYPTMDGVTGSEIDAYLAQRPLPAAPEEKLQAINEQLWILHFINPSEAFANWRRSGYPELLSAAAYWAVTIDSQTIPRRLNYPLFESSYNKAGYESAISALGGSDNWNQRVWWDKE
ncbi:MAG: SusD/RagB family nutrient-binding outer membrane lipoprotein [Bacteroides sp.]|nr:SusD/RagB family nutrient-binding outer membrane lipoprotein [Bacteroides sp.]